MDDNGRATWTNREKKQIDGRMNLTIVSRRRKRCAATAAAAAACRDRREKEESGESYRPLVWVASGESPLAIVFVNK